MTLILDSQTRSVCSFCHFPAFLQISIVTLRFFEELLRLPDPRILQQLVLHNLEERSYILRSPAGQEEYCSREQETYEDGL